MTGNFINGTSEMLPQGQRFVCYYQDGEGNTHHYTPLFKEDAEKTAYWHRVTHIEKTWVEEVSYEEAARMMGFTDKRIVA